MRVQLAIAPAGTGKTTALAGLARAWTAGGGSVLGLAPSAVAAAGLREAVGGHCDIVTKLVWALDTGNRPAWATDIGPGTLVIVDEAGMAALVSSLPSSTICWAGAGRCVWSATTGNWPRPPAEC
jgi:ATP-dependent exoDNAse (exonuclease V) alpha subunit